MQTTPTPPCALGFTFDSVSNKCRLEWNIAGRANGIENLTILCPNDFEYDEASKSCVVKVGITNVISIPIVCDKGMKLDHKLTCKEVWDG